MSVTSSALKWSVLLSPVILYGLFHSLLIVMPTVEVIAAKTIRQSHALFGLWTPYLPHGSFNPLVPSGEVIREEAAELYDIVDSLRNTQYFRIFRVDLQKECPLWVRQDLCSSPVQACNVCECPDDQIPEPFKLDPYEEIVNRQFYDGIAATPWSDNNRMTLSGMAGKAEQRFLNNLTGDSSIYVDLSMNPPGFTQYKGKNIWQLIYTDHCIRDSGVDFHEHTCTFHEDEAYEQMISGMQTLIMALSSEYNHPIFPKHTEKREFMDAQLTLGDIMRNRMSQFINRWSGNETSASLATKHDNLPDSYLPDLNLYKWRVNNEQWINNLYFDYSVLVRTAKAVQGIIDQCSCNTGSAATDEYTRQLLAQLSDFLDTAPSAAPQRLDTPVFHLKQHIAIDKMGQVNNIMDCIECEKCRLHGKVKATALQVALKTLGPQSQPVTSLARNEITALINALAMFADGVMITQRMADRALAARRLLFSAIGTVVAFSFYVTALVVVLVGRGRGRTNNKNEDDNCQTISPINTRQENENKDVAFETLCEGDSSSSPL